GGSVDTLERVRDAVDVPVLRKDFVVDEAQLDAVESDVVLLIASIGAALIVRYLLQFGYGSDRRGVTASVDASNLAFDPLG
ncbi:hypothetical protein PM032_18465, partial [Halorubrum ezzemoulense]|nr:hypothetical protein [Halorubrum ezzemoulense]